MNCPTVGSSSMTKIFIFENLLARDFKSAGLRIQD
jgi:hypothetical protein